MSKPAENTGQSYIVTTQKQFVQCLSVSEDLIREIFRASSQSLRVTDSSVWIERKWDPRCSMPKLCSQEPKGQLPEKD